jgi:hypothetical protein
MKKLFTLSGILLIAGACLLLQCRKKESDTTNPVPPKVDRTGLPTPQGSCNCGSKPSGCSGLDCVDKLFGGKDSKTFTVDWQGCVDPDPSNTYCNGPLISGTVSTLKLCYNGSCDHITAILSNPPSCLPCLPDPYCISLGISCQKNDFTFTGSEIFPRGSITVMISCNM